MKVVLVGVGNMGSAMARAWLRTSVVDSSKLTLFDTDPEKLADVEFASKTEEINSRIASADVIVLAIKPQDLKSAATHLAPIISENSILVSILAGVSLEKLSKSFSKLSKIVRVMPNIGARICQSMTAYVCSNDVKSDQAKKIAMLLAALGPVERLESEEMMDAWCAVAGSGPGFILALMQSFVEAATANGFSADVAEKMVRQTFYGTGMLAKEPTFSLSDLKSSVTSKGGTTAAGLEVFENQQISRAIAKMVEAACSRAKELNSSSS